MSLLDDGVVSLNRSNDPQIYGDYTQKHFQKQAKISNPPKFKMKLRNPKSDR